MTRKQVPWKAIARRALFGVLLAVVTHQSLVPVPASIFTHWSDKFLHVGAWLVVAIALGSAFPKAQPIWLPFLILFGYSVMIEFGQYFVPGRSLSGFDIFANGAGCGLGLLMTLLCIRWLDKKINI